MKYIIAILALALALFPIQGFAPINISFSRVKPSTAGRWHRHWLPRKKPTTQILQVLPGVSPSSYYLTRIVFLRALALVYFVAFTVALRQNKALIGDEGITPARYELLEARQRARLKRENREAWIQQMFDENGQTEGQKRKNSEKQNNGSFLNKLVLKLRKHSFYQRTRQVLWDRADRMGRPLLTVLWLAEDDYSRINPWLDGVALTGMSLAAMVGLLGAANVPIILGLWICQRSLMAVGGCWYGFGWEPQLAELGFHALFLVPHLSLNPISPTPVPMIVIYAIRWYLFRIMLGAGLIKFRSGDPKWKNLTTMNYFYETQPVPSILTKTMHFMPPAWHKFEVLTNHFVEVVAPFLLILPFVPRQLLRFSGLLQMQFQTILICTGNLSFLNWLTMVPAIFCLDDGFLRRLFSSSRVIEAAVAAAVHTPSTLRMMVSLAFGALVAWLSIPVVQNLLSKRQRMNGSFDPLRLINTYGAFGVVGEQREEWIIKSATEINGEWKEYEFKVKPGPIDRPPRWITPYHYRLDWQIWIAATCGTLDRSPWMYRFLVKLLQRDERVQKLLAKDPWENEPIRPKFIRVDSYIYQFHRGKEGPYWDRKFSKRVYPREGVATISSLTDEIPPHRRPI